MNCCSDCKWGRKKGITLRAILFRLMGVRFCQHPECRDPLDGTQLALQVARSRLLGPCGPHGKLFEARNARDK